MPSSAARSKPTTEQRQSNGPLIDIDKDDTLILIFGQTGAGKSTFVNQAVGATVAEVGHGISSKTKCISHFFTSRRGRRFIFADTPGFDDTVLEDSEILGGIASWLKKSGALKMKVLIIYLIEIDQPRQNDGGTNMNPAKLMNGTLNAHLVIATTKWSNLVSVTVGERRERELSKAWSCKVHRFSNTQDSAWAIADSSSRTPIVKLSEFGDKLAGVLPKPKKRGFFRALFSSLF